jgi:hypothetical protein
VKKSSSRSPKTNTVESIPAPELMPETRKVARRRKTATAGSSSASAPPRARAAAGAAPKKRASRTPTASGVEAMPPPADPDPRPLVTDEDIRTRAYFLYLEHGAAAGSDVDFWLIAERELRGTKEK